MTTAIITHASASSATGTYGGALVPVLGGLGPCLEAMTAHLPAAMGPEGYRGARAAYASPQMSCSAKLDPARSRCRSASGASQRALIRRRPPRAPAAAQFAHVAERHRQ